MWSRIKVSLLCSFFENISLKQTFIYCRLGPFCFVNHFLLSILCRSPAKMDLYLESYDGPIGVHLRDNLPHCNIPNDQNVVFIFIFIITNWVKRSNICGLALCPKKKSKMQFLPWVNEWMKVNEILWMKRQQMASLHYVCLI